MYMQAYLYTHIYTHITHTHVHTHTQPFFSYELELCSYSSLFFSLPPLLSFTPCNRVLCSLGWPPLTVCLRRTLTLNSWPSYFQLSIAGVTALSRCAGLLLLLVEINPAFCCSSCGYFPPVFYWSFNFTLLLFGYKKVKFLWLKLSFFLKESFSFSLMCMYVSLCICIHVSRCRS